MEISASTTTTDAEDSAPFLDTMAATISRPNAAATTTVRTAIIRFVRDPAISQLSTSAPTPSVPRGCAMDGDDHTLKPSVSSKGCGVHSSDMTETNSHSPTTTIAYLPLDLRHMDANTVFTVRNLIMTALCKKTRNRR